MGPNNQVSAPGTVNGLGTIVGFTEKKLTIPNQNWTTDQKNVNHSPRLSDSSVTTNGQHGRIVLHNLLLIVAFKSKSKLKHTIQFKEENISSEGGTLLFY